MLFRIHAEEHMADPTPYLCKLNLGSGQLYTPPFQQIFALFTGTPQTKILKFHCLIEMLFR